MLMKQSAVSLILSAAMAAAALEIAPDNWTAFNQMDGISVKDGIFTARTTGNDPFMSTATFAPVKAEDYDAVRMEIRMPKDATNIGQIFFRTAPGGSFRGNDVDYPYHPTGGWDTVTVPLGSNGNWKGTIYGMRLDPTADSNKMSVFELRRFELIKKKGSSVLELKIKDAKPLTLGCPEEFFTPSGAMKFKGRVRFPLGLTTLPSVKNSFREAAEAGFDHFMATSNGIFPELISESRKYGLYLALYYYYKRDQTPESFVAGLRKLYHDNPGLEERVLYFEGEDEAVWNNWPLAPMRAAFEGMKKFEFRRPLYLCQAPRNKVGILKKYNEFSDCSGADIYPWPDGIHSELPNKTLSAVGEYTDKSFSANPAGRPVFMALQGYGRGKDAQCPDFPQSRFMAYNAIMHGATGLEWYGLNHEKPGTPMWPVLRDLAMELRSFESVLIEPWNSRLMRSGNIEVRFKVIAGKPYIFAAEVEGKPGTLSFTSDSGIRTLETVFENRSVRASAKGVFTDSFAPWAVHVYGPRQFKAEKTSFKTAGDDRIQFLSGGEAEWIWPESLRRKPNSTAYFRFPLHVGKMPAKASIMITADDMYRLYCNGKFVGEDWNFSKNGWMTAEVYDLKPFLHADSENLVAVEVKNLGSAAGLWASISLDGQSMVTNELWRCSGKFVPGWTGAIADEGWENPESYGALPAQPWGRFMLVTGK